MGNENFILTLVSEEGQYPDRLAWFEDVLLGLDREGEIRGLFSNRNARDGKRDHPCQDDAAFHASTFLQPARMLLRG
jgi:hypothetical protein